MEREVGAPELWLWAAVLRRREERQRESMKAAVLAAIAAAFGKG